MWPLSSDLIHTASTQHQTQFTSQWHRAHLKAPVITTNLSKNTTIFFSRNNEYIVAVLTWLNSLHRESERSFLSLAAAPGYTVHTERHWGNKGRDERGSVKQHGEVTLRSWMKAHAKQPLWISFSFSNPLSDPPMFGPIIWGRPQPTITGP